MQNTRKVKSGWIEQQKKKYEHTSGWKPIPMSYINYIIMFRLRVYNPFFSYFLSMSEPMLCRCYDTVPQPVH